MQRYSISQLPVVRDGELASLADVIGSLQDRALLDRVFKNADALHEDVAVAMQRPLRRSRPTRRSTRSSTALTGGTNAVVVADARQAGRRRHALRPARVPRPRTRLTVRRVTVRSPRSGGYVVAHQGFAPRFRRARRGDVEAAIGRLQAVQLDSISTVDRAHRLTLVSRIGAVPTERRLAPAPRRADLRVLGTRGVPAPDRALAALPRA